MSEIYRNLSASEIAEQIALRWITSERTIDADAIKNKGWSSTVVADSINPMEAEWLSESINAQSCENIVISFDYSLKLSASYLFDLSRDEILSISAENSASYVVLTNLNEGYLFYIDQSNAYFLICGPESFVASAYKCSFDTSRKMYFEWWANDKDKYERDYLTKIWDTYTFKK